jgi:hypothetical protein
MDTDKGRRIVVPLDNNMAILRRILRVTGLAGFVVFALLAVILISGFPKEVSRNSTLIQSFSSAASWIDDFRKVNGRLPSSDEYKAWAATEPEHVYGVRSISLLTPSSSEFYQEAVAALGEPDTAGGYVLAIWTGDSNEYYASWANKSTVHNSPRYYGLIFLLGMFFILAACVCWYVGHRCRATTGSNETPPG